MTFGKKLKEARESKGISQAVLAESLGYGTAQFISNMERDISFPPISKLKKMAKVIDKENHSKLAYDLFEQIRHQKLERMSITLNNQFQKSK